MSLLEARHLEKRYGDQIVLERIGFRVETGEFVTLVGASGCGKTTFLKLLLGTERISRGALTLDDRPLPDEPGPDRGVVFQRYSVFPHLTVLCNVMMAEELAGSRWLGKLFGAARRRAVETARARLEEVGLAHALHKYPHELSGGMQQRLAIAQALMMRPRILLLDEPFGALDALTRAHLQEEVMRIQDELGNTVIMITHDVDEAVLLSDRIVMLTNGPSARIGEILDIELPRPRDRIALADDPRYNHYRQEVLRFLYEKQRKVESLAQRRGAGNEKQKDEKEKAKEKRMAKA